MQDQGAHKTPKVLLRSICCFPGLFNQVDIAQVRLSYTFIISIVLCVQD